MNLKSFKSISNLLCIGLVGHDTARNAKRFRQEENGMDEINYTSNKSERLSTNTSLLVDDMLMDMNGFTSSISSNYVSLLSLFQIKEARRSQNEQIIYTFTDHTINTK